jgi:hypothetical protein
VPRHRGGRTQIGVVVSDHLAVFAQTADHNLDVRTFETRVVGNLLRAPRGMDDAAQDALLRVRVPVQAFGFLPGLYGPGSNLTDHRLIEVTGTGELIIAGGTGNGYRLAELMGATNPSGWSGVLKVKTPAGATAGYILLYSNP